MLWDILSFVMRRGWWSDGVYCNRCCMRVTVRLIRLFRGIVLLTALFVIVLSLVMSLRGRSMFVILMFVLAVLLVNCRAIGIV